MGHDIKRSVSFYSYQDNQHEGILDFEGCLREASKAGATGFEIISEQTIKHFPDSVETDEFKEKWFGAIEKYNMEPVCYDSFLENHIYDNRMLTIPEQIKMMNRDIRIAKLLGFKVLRTLCSTPMPVIEGSIPYAEEMDLKLGIEVHAPFSLNSGWADGYYETIYRTGTKHFGFIPDFGMFCNKMPDIFEANARREGAREDCIKVVNEDYLARCARGFQKIKYDLDLGRANREYRLANGMNELFDKLKSMNAGPADMAYASRSYQIAWNNPHDIVDNAQYIFHTHGKCFNINENYEETSQPLADVIAAYKEAGYTGYISTEYEGQGSSDPAEGIIEIEQVRRHQEALRRAIEG